MAIHRIIIAGSKAWPVEDEPQVRVPVTDWVLANTIEGDTLTFIRGDFVSGVDTFVDVIAASFTGPRIVTVETYPTNPIYGSFKDQVRNRQMLDSGAEVVMVFVNSESESAGNLARMASKANVPVVTTTHS